MKQKLILITSLILLIIITIWAISHYFNINVITTTSTTQSLTNLTKSPYKQTHSGSIEPPGTGGVPSPKIIQDKWFTKLLPNRFSGLELWM